MKRYIIEIEMTTPHDLYSADWAEDLRLSSQEQLHRVVVRQRFADGQTSHPETVVGDERTCERCGAYTDNGAGHWLEELDTEDRLCTDCYKTASNARATTKTPVSDVATGDTIIVTIDDRPSATMRVTVADVSYVGYSFQDWYEIIDTDGNHWQYSTADLVDVES